MELNPRPDPPGPVSLFSREAGVESRMDFDSVDEALEWIVNNVDEGAPVQLDRIEQEGQVVFEEDRLREEIAARREEGGAS